jgi:hypothetical protein
VTPKSFFDNYPKRQLSVAAGTVAVLATGFVMLLTVLQFIEDYLAPWYSIPPEFQPAIGTLERTINDSFENGSLGLLMLIIFLSFFIFQIALLLIGLRRTDDASLPWKLSATNSFVIGVGWLLCFNLNPYYPPKGSFETWSQSISYGRLLPGIIVMLVVLMSWIVIQLRLSLNYRGGFLKQTVK